MKDNNNHNIKRPVFTFGVSLAIAVILYMAAGASFAYICVSLLIISTAVLCIFGKYRLSKICLSVTLAFVIGAASFFFNENCVVAPSLNLCEKKADIRGFVDDYPIRKSDNYMVVLSNCEINGERTKLKICLYCSDASDFSPGDIIEAGNSEFYLRLNDNEYYYHTLSTGSWLSAFSQNINLTEKYTGRSVFVTVKKLRNNLIKKLFGHLDTENTSVAAALLLGDKSMLSNELVSSLRITGASHLFAVSGMHLNIWASLIFFILRKRSKNRIVPNIVSTVFVLFYMLITGLSPSVIRAGIMLITVFIGKIIKKHSDPANSIGLSSSIMLLNNIYLAGNVSFLLSFFATAAIISLYPYFSTSPGQKILNPKYRLISVKNTVFLSLCVLLFTAPISGFFFGSVSLLAPVSSVLCSLPVAAVIITSFLSLCTGASFIYSICALCCKTLTNEINYLAKYDFCLYPLNMKRVCIYYGISAALLLTVYILSRKNRKDRMILTVLFCTAIILVAETCVNISTYNNTFIYIPSCGNATNICLSSFNSTYNVLIGTGKDYKDYYSMQSYMRKNGIFSFEAVILPRLSEPESAMLDSYLGYSKTIYEGGSFFLTLDNGYTYENINTDCFSAGILKNEDIKAVFSFYPGGDFKNADGELFNGDYLICRGGIPKNLNTAGFDSIIVLSDKASSVLKLPERASTTADTGDIIIRTDGRSK